MLENNLCTTWTFVKFVHLYISSYTDQRIGHCSYMHLYLYMATETAAVKNAMESMQWINFKIP